MNIARMMVYGLLCFGSLAAAFSNLALWFFDRDKQNRRLGLLCLAFALRVSYPFFLAAGPVCFGGPLRQRCAAVCRFDRG